MGLYRNYLRFGRNAGNQLFGIQPHHKNGATPLSMLISEGAKFNNSK